MKHLLTGVAMAAALAIAAPVWAQSTPTAPAAPPAAPSKPMSSTPSSSTPMASKPMPMASKPMPKKPMHHMASHKGGMMSQGDQMTEQLNQQELQRIQSGSPPAMPAGGMAPGNMSPGGNNPTTGAAAPTAGIGK
jgi:hypothetical protein